MRVGFDPIQVVAMHRDSNREAMLSARPNMAVKRDCGTGVAGFLSRLRAAAPYLQRWAFALGAL